MEMTTPKQSKYINEAADVDSSHTDRGDGYTHYEGDDCSPPTPSSLREQIQIVLDAVANGSAPEDTLVMDNMVDTIMSLITTYIEAAEIDARIDLIFEVPLYPPAKLANWKAKQYTKLQAQKAVLESKDA